MAARFAVVRETTKAWVDDTGPLTLLPDGSFLFASDRTGYRHLYHYAADGNSVNPVTEGQWEVNKVEYADGEWVYFTSSKDAGSGTNLCRAKIDGSAIERLTPEAGMHMPVVSPKAKLFVDTFSSGNGPAKVLLRESAGQLARTMDTNPVYSREEYRFGKVEPVEIPLADGFTLSGVITYPPDFDPSKRYPIWSRLTPGRIPRR